VEVSRVRFVPPALPKLKPPPPIGADWSYAVKLDGFRARLHKAEGIPRHYAKGGGDLVRRFPAIAAAVLALPTRSCIIDGELIAAGERGEPDFRALLHGRHVAVCVYAFDLMELGS
jgi:bifunctional non-homologous end joining protein LigD